MKMIILATLLLLSLSTVKADIISQSWTGSNQYAGSPNRQIEGFFFGSNLTPVVVINTTNATSNGNDLPTEQSQGIIGRYWFLILALGLLFLFLYRRRKKRRLLLIGDDDDEEDKNR